MRCRTVCAVRVQAFFYERTLPTWHEHLGALTRLRSLTLGAVLLTSPAPPATLPACSALALSACMPCYIERLLAGCCLRAMPQAASDPRLVTSALQHVDLSSPNSPQVRLCTQTML